MGEGGHHPIQQRRGQLPGTVTGNCPSVVKISRSRLATLMHTSRTQVARMLDPDDGNVTIETLQRAAAVVGRRVELQLV